MTDDDVQLIRGADGRAVKVDTRCPACAAPKNKRVNTAGFGPPVICCGVCGHHFEGATEC